jgi:outer membrane protein assembly factor BamB
MSTAWGRGCTLFLAACVIAVAAPALAAPDSTADWTATLSADVKWQQTTPSGVLVVGTGSGIVGLDGGSGKVLWQMADLENAGLMVLPQPPYGLLEFKRGARGITRLLVNLESGREVWDSSALGMSEIYRQLYVVWRDAFLIAGKTAEGEVVALVDASTGRRLSTLAVAKRQVRDLLDLPLFYDSDSTLTIATGDHLTQYRLGDGGVAWTSPKLKMGDMSPCDPLAEETKKRFLQFTPPPTGVAATEQPKRTDPRPLPPFAAMTTSLDGRHIFALRGSKLHAVVTKDGRPAWEDVPQFCGRCVEVASLEDGVLARTMQELDGPDVLYMLDAASGAVRWRYPPPRSRGIRATISSLLGNHDALSNPVFVNGAVHIVAGKSLVRIDPATGTPTILGPTRIEANDATLSLELTDEGFLVSGPQDLEWLDGNGASIRSIHFDPPGDTGLGLAALGLSALADTRPRNRLTLSKSESIVQHGAHRDVTRSELYVKPNYELAERLLLRDYHASSRLDTLAFMLSDHHGDGIDGPALVAISLRGGHVVRRIPVSKKPRYLVDAAHARMFVIEGRKIRGHAL